MHRVVVATVLGVAGCSCPPGECTAWSDVILEGSGWRAGPGELVVRHGEATLRCAVRSEVDGVAPRPADLDCDGVVRVSTIVPDTSGTADPRRLELALPVGKGDDVPTALSVRLVSRGDGGEVVLVDTTTTLEWQRSVGLPRVCAEGCRFARTVVAVP